MRGKAKKNWTAVSHELIFAAVFLGSSSQGGLCTSRSSKELGHMTPFSLDGAKV
jgi:hypothetical protein